MSEDAAASKSNGNKPKLSVTLPETKRLRASGPILILAVLFVVGAFLSWYFSWFGRSLSNADISTYLSDQKHPRRVQHALLQVQERMARGDPTARQWYPQIVRLAGDPETEFRLTAAWVMGFDNRASEFHQSLAVLLKDREPIVRRNAALALLRFGDASGREELRAILQPYALAAPVSGVVESSLKEQSPVARGTLMVRLRQANNVIDEVRSPLHGRVERITLPPGTAIAAGETLLTLTADEESIWEAMRGLSLVGDRDDLPVLEQYERGAAPGPKRSDRIKEQAALTAKAIRSRFAESK
ncbi:MAG TPA: HEAT repeat domain-containing protein [Pyrinomonadaceae bacterium]|nr:HEAT repeat domain-containing protein [Pyrinomonadaceae bacterium]